MRRELSHRNTIKSLRPPQLILRKLTRQWSSPGIRAGANGRDLAIWKGFEHRVDVLIERAVELAVEVREVEANLFFVLVRSEYATLGLASPSRGISRRKRDLLTRLPICR